MLNSNKLTLLALLFLPAHVRAGGAQAVAAGSWEPLAIRTKAGVVAQYSPGWTNTVTLNGSGVSELANRIPNADSSTDLTQGTALNQPLFSRADNVGNLAIESEDFSVWTLSNLNPFGATDTGGAGAGSFANTSRTTDPLGGNTADFLQEDSTASTSHLLSKSAGSLAAASYAYDVYAKPDGRTWIRLFIQTDAGLAVRCYFDVQNGTVGTASAINGATNPSGSITSIGSGWYRCTVRGTFPSQDGYTLGINIAEANNDIVFSGDNTSGLFFWGLSLRETSWDSTYAATTTLQIFPGLAGRPTLALDGSAHYIKTSSFTLNQPTLGIIGVRAFTWTDTDYVFDGDISSVMALYQSGATPTMKIVSGGSGVADNTDLAVGTWGAVVASFDGASSFVVVDNGTPTTGNPGSSNAGGFTLGSLGTGTTQYGHIQCSDVILCNQTNAAPELNWLKYGIMRKAGAL